MIRKPPLCYLLAILPFSTQALTIEVITASTVPVNINVDSAYHVRYLEIDTLSRAIDALNFDLEKLPKERAKEEAIKFMTEESERIKEASYGIKLVHDYHVRQIPAIVFNEGEAVVYGASDVRSALSIYERWKRKAA